MVKNEYGRIEMHPMPEVQKAKVMFIGEYPNMTELKEGRFFISDGAETLRETVSSLGIPVEDCGFTVAVPYLMNKKNKIIPPERWDRERNRIISEIIESGAKIVVPLGAMAANLLMNTRTLTIKKVLGNILELPEELPGVKIVVNYHPAMLLHQPGAYKQFYQVFSLVARLYLGKKVSPGTTRWAVVKTLADLQHVISEVQKVPYVAADIETSSLATHKAEIWVMGVTVATNTTYVICHEMFEEYPEEIEKLFDTKCKWIWHGGKYDGQVLYWRGFDKARLDEDTMLLHYCLNETGGTHSLGTCSTVYLGADEYKSKMNSEFAAITTIEAYTAKKEDLIERVAVDADYTFQLYEVFKPQVEDNVDLNRLYNDLLMPMNDLLVKIQMRGAKIDRKHFEARVPFYEQQIEEATQSIVEAAAVHWDPEEYKETTGAKTAGKDFKPTSVKQLAWMIYDRLQIKPSLKVRGKPRATGADVLESIVNPPEFIMRILDLRKVKKEYKAFCASYLTLADDNDIVHPNFNLHATTSGRLSCTEPNLQQVPSGKPEIRRGFVGRANNRIIMEVDYSGAELRVLAWISQDEGLIKAVTTGDLHSEVAAMIFGPDFTKAQRGLAKTVNFGIAYGRGASDLSVSFGYSIEECQRWIDSWAELYPKAWAYLVGCGEAVARGEILKTPYGRYRRFGLVSSQQLKSLSNEAKNFRIQSISSDNTLMAVLEADPVLIEKYDALIVNLIHDSVLIDCPADPETVMAVSKYMSETMVSIPNKMYGCNVEFHSDTDLGPNWGDVVGYDNSDGTVSTKQGKMKYEDWIVQFGIDIIKR